MSARSESMVTSKTLSLPGGAWSGASASALAEALGAADGASLGLGAVASAAAFGGLLASGVTGGGVPFEQAKAANAAAPTTKERRARRRSIVRSIPRKRPVGRENGSYGRSPPRVSSGVAERIARCDAVITGG